MNKQEFLESIRKQIHFVFDRDSIEKEYNAHIEDSILDLMEEGCSKEEAERIAIEQMGDPIEIGKALNEEHHPLLGYLWVASRFICVLFLIPVIYLANDYCGEIISYVNKESVDNEYVASFELNKKVDLEYHTIYLDEINLIYDDWDYYQITYHTYLKWDLNRSGASRTMFYVENNGEIYENNWTHCTPFGSYGSISFDGKDGKVNLVFVDGTIIEIDLEEYRNEKK